MILYFYDFLFLMSTINIAKKWKIVCGTVVMQGTKDQLQRLSINDDFVNFYDSSFFWVRRKYIRMMLMLLYLYNK